MNRMESRREAHFYVSSHNIFSHSFSSIFVIIIHFHFHFHWIHSHNVIYVNPNRSLEVVKFSTTFEFQPKIVWRLRTSRLCLIFNKFQNFLIVMRLQHTPTDICVNNIFFLVNVNSAYSKLMAPKLKSIIILYYM